MTTPKSRGPGRKPGRFSSQKASESTVQPRKDTAPNQQNIPQTVMKVCVSCGDDERMRPEETRCAFCRKHDVIPPALVDEQRRLTICVACGGQYMLKPGETRCTLCRSLGREPMNDGSDLSAEVIVNLNQHVAALTGDVKRLEGEKAHLRQEATLLLKERTEKLEALQAKYNELSDLYQPLRYAAGRVVNTSVKSPTIHVVETSLGVALLDLHKVMMGQKDAMAWMPEGYAAKVTRLQEDNDMLRKTMERLSKRLGELSARAMLPTEENGVDVTTVRTQPLRELTRAAEALCLMVEQSGEEHEHPRAVVAGTKMLRDALKEVA